MKLHITLDSFAKIVSLPLLVDDILVDLPSGQIVVFGESDVEEALIVTQVQVHFPSIIQHKHLPCSTKAQAHMSEGNGQCQQLAGFACEEFNVRKHLLWLIQQAEEWL